MPKPGGEDGGGAVDLHRQLLVLGGGLVRRLPCGFQKHVGDVLADADGVQGVRDLQHAKLEWGLLWVPLGACASNQVRCVLQSVSSLIRRRRPVCRTVSVTQSRQQHQHVGHYLSCSHYMIASIR
jgi:hypothetical protein